MGVLIAVDFEHRDSAQQGTPKRLQGVKNSAHNNDAITPFPSVIEVNFIPQTYLHILPR
jgi:hypothetical protein